MCGVLQVGLSHSAVLRWILCSACARQGRDLPLTPMEAQSAGRERSLPLTPPEAQSAALASQLGDAEAAGTSREEEAQQGEGGRAGGPGRPVTPVWVLFGGTTAERQVSLISGTNVWLKLRGQPQVFCLCPAESALGCCTSTLLSHVPRCSGGSAAPYAMSCGAKHTSSLLVAALLQLSMDPQP